MEIPKKCCVRGSRQDTAWGPFPAAFLFLGASLSWILLSEPINYVLVLSSWMRRNHSPQWVSARHYLEQLCFSSGLWIITKVKGWDVMGWSCRFTAFCWLGLRELFCHHSPPFSAFLNPWWGSLSPGGKRFTWTLFSQDQLGWNPGLLDSQSDIFPLFLMPYYISWTSSSFSNNRVCLHILISGCSLLPCC